MPNQLEFKAGSLAEVSANAQEKSITFNAKAQVVNALSGTETDKAPSVSAVKTALNGKVGAVSGKGLSSNDYTDAEKQKLAGLESSRFKGQFTSLTALNAVTGSEGAYAYVDGGAGADVTTYIWDTTDRKWVDQKGSTTTETPASIKQKYESNADTNAFTDAEKAKLAGVAAGAEVNQNAFAKITVGGVTATAAVETDTFSVVAGEGVSVVLNSSTKTITFSSNGINAIKVGDTVMAW